MTSHMCTDESLTTAEEAAPEFISSREETHQPLPDPRPERSAPDGAAQADTADRHLIHSILRGLPMPYLLVDANERVVRTNQATLEMLEIDGSVESCYGKTLAEVFYNDPTRKTFVGQSIHEGYIFRDIHVPMKNHRGKERHVLANVFPLYGPDDICIGGMCIYVDSTEGKQIEFQLKARATTDSLTGLNNRQHFLELAKLLFDTTKRYGSNLVVAIFDIDHFKSVNDTRGHDAGDQVLRSLSKTALATLRVADVLGRIGGEEFAVALPETNYPEAMKALERLRHVVESTPIVYERQPVTITISCGMAPLTCADCTLEGLLKKADEALYMAKRGGRNRVVAIFEPSAGRP